jgi:soluble lytic murein transglycosylase-like protein
MRPRLITLLLVTVVSGVIAGFVGNATAGKARRAAQPAGRTTFHAGPCPIPVQFHTAFAAASRDTGLPLAMLVAVATVESDLKPDARSSAGAHGLLQVLPSTAHDLNLDPSKPTTNVLAGARYLRQMLERFHSTDLALAAYNAGPTAVAKAGGPPSRGTSAYVTRVTELWRSLQGCT